MKSLQNSLSGKDESCEAVMEGTIVFIILKNRKVTREKKNSFIIETGNWKEIRLKIMNGANPLLKMTENDIRERSKKTVYEIDKWAKVKNEVQRKTVTENIKKGLEKV